MNQIVGYLVIVFVALIAVVLMAIWSQKNYGKGFDDGVQYENHRLYKVRLLRQTRRAARAEEAVDATFSAEGSDAGVQGNTESGDSEPERGTLSLFEHDIDASGDSTAERVGGQGVSEVGGSRDVA
jgi:hypothetical protein